MAMADVSDDVQNERRCEGQCQVMERTLEDANDILQIENEQPVGNVRDHTSTDLSGDTNYVFLPMTNFHLVSVVQDNTESASTSTSREEGATSAVACIQEHPNRKRRGPF
jgi:hypothetical protein